MNSYINTIFHTSNLLQRQNNNEDLETIREWQNTKSDQKSEIKLSSSLQIQTEALNIKLPRVTSLLSVTIIRTLGLTE